MTILNIELIGEGEIYNRRPYLELCLGPQTDISKTGGKVRHSTPIKALIDTGADLNYISPVVSHALGANAWTEANVTAVGAYHKSRMCVGSVIFPEHGHLINTSFVEAPVRSDTTPHDLVLGRLFLRLGVLTMDYPANRFTFEM